MSARTLPADVDVELPDAIGRVRLELDRHGQTLLSVQPEVVTLNPNGCRLLAVALLDHADNHDRVGRYESRS